MFKTQTAVLYSVYKNKRGFNILSEVVLTHFLVTI